MRAVVGAAFDNDTVRHRFFARFLPGHSKGRPYWNPRLRIDLTDLELFRAYPFRSPSSAETHSDLQSNPRRSPFPTIQCMPLR